MAKKDYNKLFLIKKGELVKLKKTSWLYLVIIIYFYDNQFRL